MFIIKLDVLKQILLSIEKDIIRVKPDTPVYFHQQEKKLTNMAFMGINGETLWIVPRSNGFSIGLSGKALEHRMGKFMLNLVGREQDGYSQSNSKKGKQDLPFWVVSDTET